MGGIHLVTSKATLTTASGGTVDKWFHHSYLVVVFVFVLAVGRVAPPRRGVSEEDWLADLVNEADLWHRPNLAGALADLGSVRPVSFDTLPLEQAKGLTALLEDDRQLTREDVQHLMESVFGLHSLKLELPRDFDVTTVTVALVRRVWKETMMDADVISTDRLCDFAAALTDEAHRVAMFRSFLHRTEASPVVPDRDDPRYGHWRDSSLLQVLGKALENESDSLTIADLELEAEVAAELDLFHVTPKQVTSNPNKGSSDLDNSSGARACADDDAPYLLHIELAEPAAH